MTSPASPPPSHYLSPTSRLLFRPIEAVATGGCHAEVFLPKEGAGEGSKGWPVAIFIHGGAFTAGGCSDISLRQIEYLLDKGVVCASIEYRLAPHADLAVQASDCLAAFEWVRDGGLERALREDGKLTDHGPAIDGTRVATVGYSAGGYHACMLGHQASPPLAGILSFYAVLDLEILALTPKDAAFLGQTEQEKAFALKVWDLGVITDDVAANRANPVNPRSAWMRTVMISGSMISHILPTNLPPTLETRRLLSPHHLLSSSSKHPYPPTYLAIPELDTLVPPSQSWRFAERIKGVGGEVVTKRANGAGHAFDLSGGERNEGGGDWYEEVIKPGLDFLAQKLGV